VVGALLAAVSGGFLERYTDVSRTTAFGPELVRWFVEQPGFEEDSGRIAIAGDRFNQRLELVPQWASCREVKAIARRMPVVVTVPLFFEGTLGVEGYSGARCLANEKPILDRDPFYVYRLRG
jgi:hypothetical protein